MIAGERFPMPTKITRRRNASATFITEGTAKTGGNLLL